MSAIMGTFVKIGTMADGTPRLVLDLQCTLSEVAAMGLIPGVPFALARLEKEAAGKPIVPQEPKARPGTICVMACNFCADPDFHRWLEAEHGFGEGREETARSFVLAMCDIQSRKELDTNETAKQIFLSQIRAPFLAWKSEQ